MKYPPDSSDFEKRTYGEVKGLTDNSCCICLVSLPLPPRTEYACSDDSLPPPSLSFLFLPFPKNSTGGVRRLVGPDEAAVQPLDAQRVHREVVQ